MKRATPEKKEPTIDESLRLQKAESGFFGAMNGLTENFLVPFALFANASHLFVSLIVTLPGLVGSVAQLKAPELLKAVKSSKRYLFLLFLAHAIVWFLIASLLFIAPGRILLFLALIVIGTTTSLLLGPVWMQYMGELVPVARRARFFGHRNAIGGLVTFLTTIGAGAVISLVDGAYGFALLFILAGLARLGSAYCIKGSKEMPSFLPERKEFSIKRFLRRAPTSDFGRFVSLAILLRLAVYIASPFILVYQLEVLRFDYLLYTALQAAAVVSSFLSVKLWVSLSERRGNRRILTYSASLIILSPLFWMITDYFPILLFAQLVSGAAWSGFNFGSSNYMLEATSARTRTHAISYFNLFNQVAIVSGSLLGSALLGLFSLFSSGKMPFLILFGVSGLLRIVVVLSARLKLKELRFVEVPIKRKGITALVNVLPTQGMVYAALPSADDVAVRLHDRVSFRRELDDLHRYSDGENVAARMRKDEKDLYREKFIRQATGDDRPRKPRGLKK